MTRFSSLLSGEVMIVEASPAMWDSGLLTEEAACVEHAVPTRRREFTAGRNCAREAVRRLGLEPGPILVGSMRQPLFQPGITGSITHTSDYCAAAVSREETVSSLGIDAEINEPLAADVEELTCNTDDLILARQLRDPLFENWTTLMFSAKESFYKTFFKLRPAYIDFLEATVFVEPARAEFVIKIAAPLSTYTDEYLFRGRYSYDERLIYTAVTAIRSPAQARRGSRFLD